jgi:hypothetical protein
MDFHEILYSAVLLRFLFRSQFRSKPDKITGSLRQDFHAILRTEVSLWRMLSALWLPRQVFKVTGLFTPYRAALGVY